MPRAMLQGGRRHQRWRDRGEGHAWARHRADLLHRAGYRCAGCGRTFPPARLQVDHIRPIHRGGDIWDEANCQILCVPCHQTKTNCERRAGGWAPPVRNREAKSWVAELLDPPDDP